MNSKIVAFIALFAVLIGCAMGARGVEDSIQLHFNEGSSNWWIGVDPREELYETVKVEIRGASESEWTLLNYNPGWSYFHIASNSGRGFSLPLSFRFTADNGEQVIASIYRISPNALVDTKVQYGSSSAPATQAPSTAPTTRPTQPATQAPATEAPTAAPTSRPPTAPTTRPTTKPTDAPTQKPTERPTEAPTRAPTQKPTEKPTQAPTPKATDAPTQKPTEKPTQAPTPKATQAPTPKATQKPTEKPTEKPTQAPTPKATQAPTPKATQAPTIKPTIPPTTDTCSIMPTSAEPVKILVPLYTYPGASWDTLITAANNGAKIIAIINPNSGPNANGPDSAYTTYMKKFQTAGIEMIGYVHTQWGARSISTVNTEIGTYASKYPGVSGIFFDEAAVEASQVSYYRQAYTTVMSKGFVHSILNPGAQPVQQYLDISTNIVIFENYASELSRASFPSWVKCAPSSTQKSGYQYKFSAIIHTAPQSNMASLITQAHNMGMGLVYVTDGAGGCCTYNALTSYFAAQASAIKVLNSA